LTSIYLLQTRQQVLWRTTK